MKTLERLVSLYKPGDFLPTCLEVVSFMEHKNDPMIVATLVEEKRSGWRDIMICSVKTSRVRWLRCNTWLASYPNAKICNVLTGVAGIHVAVMTPDGLSATLPVWACPQISEFE